MSKLKAPFPYFGGKGRVADDIWARLGDVPNYVEPFFGSGAVLLGRPAFVGRRIETVNDIDGYVANFWRAIAADPDAVAEAASWPVVELDLHARELRLVEMRDEFAARLAGDPEFFDAKVAGWWAWGLSSYIGAFADGSGPWVSVDGVLTHRDSIGNAGRGVNKKRPHLGNAGKGVNKQLPRLGDGHTAALKEWFTRLSGRMRHVRVVSGDWTRIASPTVTTKHRLTGVFLDPPYGEAVARRSLYAHESGTVAADAKDWCLANGDNPLFRIALAGYAGEGHDDLVDHGWSVQAWSGVGYGAGTGGRGDRNRRLERIWYSPHCLNAQPDLFDHLDGVVSNA